MNDIQEKQRREEWKRTLAALDARTAQGIPPTAVRTPTGGYQQANSAEDAFFISRGRGDLASGNY